MKKFEAGDKVRLKKAPNLIQYDNVTVGKIYETYELTDAPEYVKPDYIRIFDDTGKRCNLKKDLFEPLPSCEKGSTIHNIFRVHNAEQAKACLAELERYGFKKFSLTEDLFFDEIRIIQVYYDGSYGLLKYKTGFSENISDFYADSKLMWNFATNSFTVVHLPVQSTFDLQTDMFKFGPAQIEQPETHVTIDAEKLLKLVDNEKMNYFELTNYLNAYIDGQKGKLK